MPATESISLDVGGGTPGADTNTYVLFDSTTFIGAGVMRPRGISRITFTVKNSQAGTLNASTSNNGGTTWDQYNSQAVLASGAGVVAGPFDYLVDTFKDWKLEWVNGGAAQATWRPQMTMVKSDRASGT